VAKAETFKQTKELQDLVFKIPESGMNYLRKYRVTDEDVEIFKIGWSNAFQRVVFPYYNPNNIYEFSWMRSLRDDQKPKWLFNGNKYYGSYWFWHNVEERTYPLIITEDVISAIRCFEFGDILALGGTHFEKEDVSRIILEYKDIILWLDGDKAGREVAKKFCKKWSPWRNVKNIKTKADPKTYSQQQIQEILNL
jgi:DNA primase